MFIILTSQCRNKSHRQACTSLHDHHHDSFRQVFQQETRRREDLLKPITQIACLNIILVALLRFVHAVLIVREHIGLDIAVRRLVARVPFDAANGRDRKRASVRDTQSRCGTGGERAEHRYYRLECLGVVDVSYVTIKVEVVER